MNNWGAAFLPAYCQGTPIGNASVSSASAVVKHIRNPQNRLGIAATAARFRCGDEPRTPARVGRRSGSPRRTIELVRVGVSNAIGDAGDSIPRQRDRRRPIDLYGIDDPVTEDFGRQCLMARRLLESWGPFRSGHAQRQRSAVGPAQRPVPRTHEELSGGRQADRRLFDRPEVARTVGRHARVVGRRVRTHTDSPRQQWP